MIDDDRFRRDLYYRISAFPIHLPAVRERPDDIPLIVDSILQRVGNAQGTAGRKFNVTTDALARLDAYSWPGNIRELRNVLDRACLLAVDGVIRIEHLPDDILEGEPAYLRSSAGSLCPLPRCELTDSELVRFAEGFSGTRSALADYLGMSQRTLYRRLKTLRQKRVER
jgi:transcriptional regulator of acetoin/glycerol metabolism